MSRRIVALAAAGVGREIAAHGFDIVQDDAGMIEQAFARRGQLDAAAAALHQRRAEGGFQPLDPRAGRRQRQMGAVGAAGDAARLGHGDEQLQVDQIETHGDSCSFESSLRARRSHCGDACATMKGRDCSSLRDFGQCCSLRTMTAAAAQPSSWPKAGSVSSRLCRQPRSVNVIRMFEPLLLLIAAAFLLAGFVKGVIGLGLPTVSMGLLAVTMQPAHALAIVIVPAIITNIWQTFVGPYLRDIIRRLWPLMVGTVIGIWLNADMLTGPYARYGTIVLGVLLVIYAIIGLNKFSFHVARRNEGWVGGIVGVMTGVVSAATGVQVIPSMPFMQAIGMEKDELVQALGVFFTVATVALAFNLTASGLLTAATALPGAVAMAAAFAGMFIGQAVRSRMQPEAFRRWFLIAMILLGLYLAGSTVFNMYRA